MVKLRHRAFAVQEGLQQRHHRVGTDSIMLSQIVYFLQAFVGQAGQGVVSLTAGRYEPAALVETESVIGARYDAVFASCGSLTQCGHQPGRNPVSRQSAAAR
jgi:hypothetical protein